MPSTTKSLVYMHYRSPEISGSLDETKCTAKQEARNKERINWSGRHDYVSIIKCRAFIFLSLPFFISYFLFYFFFVFEINAFIQDVVEDACVIVLYVLPFSSSWVVYISFSRLVANRYGKDWTYLDRCASLYRSRSQSQKRRKRSKKEEERRRKIWKASLIHQNRGDTATGYMEATAANNDSLFL